MQTPLVQYPITSGNNRCHKSSLLRQRYCIVRAHQRRHGKVGMCGLPPLSVSVPHPIILPVYVSRSTFFMSVGQSIALLFPLYNTVCPLPHATGHSDPGISTRYFCNCSALLAQYRYRHRFCNLHQMGHFDADIYPHIASAMSVVHAIALPYRSCAMTVRHAITTTLRLLEDTGTHTSSRTCTSPNCNTYIHHKITPVTSKTAQGARQQMVTS